MVQAHLFKPIEKKKEYIGILKEVHETNIQLEVEEKDIQLERNNIALLKLYYEWDNA